MLAVELRGDAYQSVEGILNHLCRQFLRKYGGTFDDWKREANYGFVQVCEQYTEGAGKFSGFVFATVRSRLLDFVRRESRYREKNQQSEWVYNRTEELCAVFDLDGLLEKLTDGAKTLVMLVLSAPEWDINGHRGSRGVNRLPLNLRKNLAEHGWSETKIRETYKEVEAVLEC